MPPEPQGPTIFPYTTLFRSDGAGNLIDEETISVRVNEVNVAPVLAEIGSKTVDEETLLTFTATATDHDLPANNLTFDQRGVPDSAAIDAHSGVIKRKPTEAQGAGDHSFRVGLRGAGTRSLFDDETISVHVNEVNVAPVLAEIGSQTVDEETLLTFTATATDHDLPANGLSFSLLGAPDGAAIDAHSDRKSVV